jgi:DNA uptake protein ComE-like DNA-binding protein
MVVIIFSEPVYRYWFTRQPIDYSQDSVRLDSLLAKWKWDTIDTSVQKQIRLFAFNPNNVSKEELYTLGFSDYLAKRFLNYRAKGGKFIIKSDLRKLYGMDTALYRKLYPFISLPQSKPALEMSTRNNRKTDSTKVRFEKADINIADTAQLIKVYGIGKKLSERIVKYRNRLGGFISMNQLNEVYGLDSAVIGNLTKKFIVEPNFVPYQLSLNSASEKELGTHPYLSFKLAKAIVAYRFQHGKFTNADDLTQIQLMTETDLKKLKPYLTINP